jgi:hypothetical protein
MYLVQAESQFRDLSELTNTRAVWWSILQIVIILGTCIWQTKTLRVRLLPCLLLSASVVTFAEVTWAFDWVRNSSRRNDCDELSLGVGRSKRCYASMMCQVLFGMSCEDGPRQRSILLKASC